MNKKDKQVKIDLNTNVVVVIDPRYRGMACYNCGEPGHFVGICSKSKICFICAMLGHYMVDCSQWKKV
jgi:hypothetical protein